MHVKTHSTSTRRMGALALAAACVASLAACSSSGGSSGSSGSSGGGKNPIYLGAALSLT